MKVSQLYPDKWLKAETLQGRTRGVVVATSTVEELYNTREKHKEWKIVLGFHGKTLRLVLNKTQALTMVQITGEDDSAKWIGHPINLTPARTQNGQDTIVISGPQKSSAPAPAPQPEPAADSDTPDPDP